MVDTVTSLSRSGLHDWLMQRVSAVILGIYVIFLAVFFYSHPQVTYDQWHQLFANLWMKIASIFVLLSLLVHAWVGLWTVTTDYIKLSALRLFIQIVIILALFACFFWGVAIFWGV